MEMLEELLQAVGIPFCRHGNCIWLVTLIYQHNKELNIYFTVTPKTLSMFAQISVCNM
jgi:hypothetical protein